MKAYEYCCILVSLIVLMEYLYVLLIDLKNSTISPFNSS